MAPSVNLPFGLRAQGIEWASERSCSRGPSYRETLVLGMVHLPGFGLKSMALHREGWVEKPCGPRRFSQSTDLLAVNALPRSFRRWRMASLWHWWPSTIVIGQNLDSGCHGAKLVGGQSSVTSAPVGLAQRFSSLSAASTPVLYAPLAVAGYFKLQASPAKDTLPPSTGAPTPSCAGLYSIRGVV